VVGLPNPSERSKKERQKCIFGVKVMMGYMCRAQSAGEKRIDVNRSQISTFLALIILDFGCKLEKIDSEAHAVCFSGWSRMDNSTTAGSNFTYSSCFKVLSHHMLMWLFVSQAPLTKKKIW
jgi:hypothetical protein